MGTRESVEKAYATTLGDMVWKPYYPNNIKGNGLEGYYCLMLHTDKNGKVSGRKYTIEFQYAEVEPGSGHINRENINAYILYEKSYSEVVGPLDYPKPSMTGSFDKWHTEDTFGSLGVNDFGSFIYAYSNIEDAKKRALRNYQMIYGYVASHMIED